jgi:hypothetical protein
MGFFKRNNKKQSDKMDDMINDFEQYLNDSEKNRPDIDWTIEDQERHKKFKEDVKKISEEKEKQQILDKKHKEEEKRKEEQNKNIKLLKKRIGNGIENKNEKMAKQNWSSVTSNTNFCATCEYWKGTREVGNISRTSLKYLTNRMQGRCHRPGLSLAGESRSATQNCGKNWRKWTMLR